MVLSTCARRPLTRKAWIGALIGLTLVAACGREGGRPVDGPDWPVRPPDGLVISGRRIEALIQCYKLIVLAQERFSGTGPNKDGVASTLIGARRMIEDRMVGDLTAGADKMRLNEKIGSDLQRLMDDKPYGSTAIILEGARYCAGLEQRDAWRGMRP